MANKTWVLADFPFFDVNQLVEWVFELKPHRSIDKFKIKLLAKGLTQKEDIDYFDTYAPVARISTIEVLIALASIYNLGIHQMDVKIAFINSGLDG